MNPSNPYFFKLPICARHRIQLFGTYDIPPRDCTIDWEKINSDDMDSPLRLYLRILHNEIKDVKKVAKFHYFDVICLYRCGHGFIKDFLTYDEIVHLVKIGRENFIKGLTEEEKVFYWRQIVFPKESI